MKNGKNKIRSATIWSTVAAAGIIVVLASVSQAANIRSIESYLRNDANLSLFTKAMDIANFWERISPDESIVLFVPTDKAMSVEGSDFLLRSVLMTKENRQRLEALVSAHIIVGSDKAKLESGSTLVPTLSGDCLTINRLEGKISVGPNAQILSDVVINDTRIMTIDKLLIPDYQPSDECTALLASTVSR